MIASPALRAMPAAPAPTDQTARTWADLAHRCRLHADRASGEGQHVRSAVLAQAADALGSAVADRLKATDLMAAYKRLGEVEPHVAIRLKSVFPRLPKTATQPFRFGHAPDVCADLDWFMTRYPMRMDAGDAAFLRGGKLDFEDGLARAERLFLPDYTPPPFRGFRAGLAPYPMQAQAIELAQLRGRLLLGDDLGLGKTTVGLGAILDPSFLPAAVVVQSHLGIQWLNRAKQFTDLRVHPPPRSTSSRSQRPCWGVGQSSIASCSPGRGRWRHPPDTLIAPLPSFAGKLRRRCPGPRSTASGSRHASGWRWRRTRRIRLSGARGRRGASTGGCAAERFQPPSG